MPRYDYKCYNCDITIEETTSLKEVAMGYRPECKKCGQIMTKIISSPAAFKIKKDDWYYISRNTDIAKKKVDKIKEQWKENPALKKRAKKYGIY